VSDPRKVPRRDPPAPGFAEFRPTTTAPLAREVAEDENGRSGPSESPPQEKTDARPSSALACGLPLAEHITLASGFRWVSHSPEGCACEHPNGEGAMWAGDGLDHRRGPPSSSPASVEGTVKPGSNSPDARATPMCDHEAAAREAEAALSSLLSALMALADDAHEVLAVMPGESWSKAEREAWSAKALDVNSRLRALVARCGGKS
jgi:hypothetical protein